MTITDATTPRRTHRPKQPENALPDPAKKPRYCCAHSKGESADAPHRVIVVDEVRWDSTRGAKGDHRIGYTNEATGRRGESWYASFKSGAEFWPAPPVEVETKAPWPPLPEDWNAMAERTGKPFSDKGAYSSVCYADWRGVVSHLYHRGAHLEGAELLLRSPHMERCANNWTGEYGKTTVEHFAKYLDKETAWPYCKLSCPPTVEKPTDPRNEAPPVPPPVAPPTAQLPLTVAVHPVDLTRALALLERLTVAAETIARNTAPVARLA